MPYETSLFVGSFRLRAHRPGLRDGVSPAPPPASSPPPKGGKISSGSPGAIRCKAGSFLQPDCAVGAHANSTVGKVRRYRGSKPGTSVPSPDTRAWRRPDVSGPLRAHGG